MTALLVLTYSGLVLGFGLWILSFPKVKKWVDKGGW